MPQGLWVIRNSAFGSEFCKLLTSAAWGYIKRTKLCLCPAVKISCKIIIKEEKSLFFLECGMSQVNNPKCQAAVLPY